MGYRISSAGLQPLPDKVMAITEAPTPTNVQELRAFLGLINYYGKFINQLSTLDLAYPLNQLLCKGTKWAWNRQCAEAFETLKAKLASSCRGAGPL